MNPMLHEALDRLLTDIAPARMVREIESGGSPQVLWRRIVESGFADAMVPEDKGGGGIALREACALFVLCGRHALPVPLAQTLVARSLCASSGVEIPEGPVAIALPPVRGSGDAIECRNVPFGMVAQSVLVPGTESSDLGGGWLLPIAKAQRIDTGVHGSLQAHLIWKNPRAAGVAVGNIPPGLELGALVTAALMAGAMDAVLQITVRYAGERSQFGRPIGKFQAIQQQLAVLAELATASKVGAELGCRESVAEKPDSLAAAAAKAQASEAAGTVVSIAHAVHAAMGITDEYDLQLYTRRLLEWRNDYGSAGYWHRRIGDAVLASDAHCTLEFMLSALFADGTSGSPH